jgi:hypothetical protein
MKGLICEIYDSPLGNCSNNGISSKTKKVTLVGENVPEIFEVSDDAPAVRILERSVRGEKYLTAYPLEKFAGEKWFMFGGAFIYSSDSRFCEISPYPVPLHDRVE